MEDTRIPPVHLTEAGKILWQKICEQVIDLNEGPALVMLQTMIEQYERMIEARAVLKRDGLLVKDRWGLQKAHPAVAIEASAVAAFARCWKLLGFDLAAPPEEVQGCLEGFK